MPTSEATAILSVAVAVPRLKEAEHWLAVFTALIFAGAVMIGAIVSMVSPTNAMTNGLSESTLALMVLAAKSGPGSSGERIVQSTNTPSSPCKTLNLLKIAGSVALGTLKVTMCGPEITACVEIS